MIYQITTNFFILLLSSLSRTGHRFLGPTSELPAGLLQAYSRRTIMGLGFPFFVYLWRRDSPSSPLASM